MAAAPMQDDRKSVRSSECRPVAQPDDPRREWRDMLPEYDRWSAEPLEEAVVDHGLSSGAQLFSWLEDSKERPGPAVRIRRQGGARTQQAGDVDVVTARMH